MWSINFCFVQLNFEKSLIIGFDVWFHILKLNVRFFWKFIGTLLSHNLKHILMCVGAFWVKAYIEVQCMESFIEARYRPIFNIYLQIDWKLVKMFRICEGKFWKKSYLELQCMNPFIEAQCKIFLSLTCTLILYVFDTFWNKSEMMVFQTLTPGLLVSHLFCTVMCRYSEQFTIGAGIFFAQSWVWFFIA